MEKIKRFNLDGYVTYYDSTEEVLIPTVYKERTQETRAVWVSNVNNIDTPVMKDIESYKQHLQSIIDKVDEYNMNTIIFQVRPSNDAYYESKLNPWSKYITGKQGKKPGFDVFGWFIERAKEKNIEVHAWINPYRVTPAKLTDLNKTKEEFLDSLAKLNFARLHPELVLETSESKLILNPASQEVRDFVSDSALEIAKNYDVRAIHIDDYFYPYEKLESEEELKIYNELYADKMSFNDFRRLNVDLLMKQISDKLKTLDKKVEFGISPFLVYRTNSKHFENGGGWERGSNNHFSCLEGYERLYADVYLWMKNKWIDYVVPQNYFDLDNPKIAEDGTVKRIIQYADLADWWVDICKETNTKLYMGQAIYRYSDKGSWNNPEEIPNQIKYNSKHDNILGTVFFTYRNFTNESVESLKEGRKILKTMWTKKVKPF